MKKFILSLLIMVILFSVSIVPGSVNANASENVKINQFDSADAAMSGEIQLEKADYDKIFESDEPVYLGDNLWAEEVTYDEMVSQIAENRDQSPNFVRTEMNNRESLAAPTASYFYVHFYKTLQVGNTNWYPQLDIYAKCEGIYRDFVGIEDLNLIRSYNYDAKQFNGKCQAKVESAKKIYWVVNGDFYNNGTTKVTFGGSVNIGEYANLSLSVESSKNHFGYIYETGYIENR